MARSWVIDKICPYVIVVTDNGNKPDYSTYIAIGNPVIDGVSHHIMVGEVLIVNHSKHQLSYSSVRYASKSYSKWFHGGDVSIISTGDFLLVDHYPDYFFTTPPSKKKSIGGMETVYVLDKRE